MNAHPNRERELTDPLNLCQPNGRLNPAAVGWSRRPLHHCNLKGRWLAKKRWNYWAVTTETHLFSLTVSNLDYAGLVFVYLADFERHTMTEKTVLIPLGRGCSLPETVDEAVRFTHRDLSVAMIPGDEGMRLSAHSPDFEGRILSAEITVSYPPNHETLNVVIPWDERTFQFTAKRNTLPAEGVVQWGSDEIRFEGEQSFACLDFGRGIWPRQCAWNWGAASGRQNGRTIGLNLGGKWTDGTGMTENGLCVAGRMSKVSEDLIWEYDRTDFMQPWWITSPQSEQIALTFTPFLERVAISNTGLVRSEVHQMFGHYDGAITTAEGETVPVRRLVGWAEEHIARW